MIQYALKAANGDSTVVRVWDKFHMSRYGAFDVMAKLPESTAQHQRILLKYTLGCLSNGQCEWDYDISLNVRRKTGLKDSTLQNAPYLRVNGNAVDSIVFSSEPTWVNTFNTTTKQTDSALAAVSRIELFNNPNNLFERTDSFPGYAANFYRYWFDSTGKKTDSSWVAATDTLRQRNTPYYNVFDGKENFELGRFISPYAKTFPKTFQYEYIFDVTDYKQFLHDSTELRIFYSGYSYGFTATWEFIYIEGKPAQEVIDIVNIYNGGFQYGANPSIEAALSEKSFTVPAGTKSVKARILITGHGGESNENCAEFCSKNYFLKLNGTQIARQLIWKDDCGSNPITAQPGTWVYNRANWCPGEAVRRFEYPLNVAAGSSNTIDMDIEEFFANGFASYKIALQLIYYKDLSHQVDPAIEDILAPTKSVWQSKFNPICDNARIILKNYGAEPMKDAWISYKLGNGQDNGILWEGNLAFGEQTEVVLPNLLWPADLTNRTFTARLATVNGKPISTDENPANNQLSSTFDLPIALPASFIIETRTNNVPSQNSYILKDHKGNIVRERTFTSASTLHRDTFNLPFGCYTFTFNDRGGNGLGWWATPGDGNGTLRMVTPAPLRVLQTVNVDFGSFYNLNFRVQHPVGIDETKVTAEDVIVYPVPATDFLEVSGVSFQKATLLDVTGKVVAVFEQPDSRLNISNLNTGVFLLQLETRSGIVYKKVSIQK